MDVEALDLPEETIAAFDRHNTNYQLAFMLVVVKNATGFDARYALEIADTLKGEFAGYSALVGLTSVFGMGTGEPHRYNHPKVCYIF